MENGVELTLKLDAAIKLATDAHAGQFDKAGEPYILHPLRVMLAQSDNRTRIVAILHDVAEDLPSGWDDIKTLGFDQEIIDAIVSVTKRVGEDYSTFIQRCASNEIGRLVKIADLRDNLRGSHGNREKYLRALEILGASAPGSN